MVESFLKCSKDKPPKIPMESRFLPSTNRLITTIAVLLCVAMGSLEGTVVATAMPKVTAELHGIHQYAWVTSIYLLASTVFIPIYGKLSDLYRRKTIMITGIFVFLIGSTLSGFASTMTQLIIFRALQGVGAGALQSIALAIIADLYTAEERARIQGVFGATWAISGFLGSFLGGIIVNKFSWHWIFFMNIPFGLLSIGLLAVFSHEVGVRKEAKLDLLGALLLSTAIITLLLGAEGKWPLWMFPSCLFFVFLFAMNEKRSKAPMFPLGLLAGRLMLVTIFASALVGALMVSMVTYLSLLLQGGLAYSATRAGFFLAPVLVCWPLSSAFTGWLLPKTGYRPLILFGFGLTMASTVVFAFFVSQGVHLSVKALKVALGCFGIGLGMSHTPLTLAIQEKVKWQQRGLATALISFSRAIGSVIGVGALGALLNITLRDRISSDMLESLVNPLVRSRLGSQALLQISGSLFYGLRAVFFSMAALSILMFIIGLFFPLLHMGKRS